jgi:hypothetical protein
MRRPIPTTSNYLSKFKVPKQIMTRIESHVVNMEAKVVTVDLNKKGPENVEIIHITDLQFGSKLFKTDRFLEYSDWILSVPNRFVILGGDIIDAATVMSVGSPYENEFQPSEQALKVRDLLGPLQPRILGYVGGNHERRTVKTFGDSGHLLASLLEIPYSCGEQHYDIHFGFHRPFKITAWHGVGAARTKGARALMLHRAMQKGDSQLYLVGHLHDCIVLYDWRQTRHTVAGKTEIGSKKIAGVMSSSFQGYWGGYAEIAGLPMSDTMMGRCILDSAGGWEITLK